MTSIDRWLAALADARAGSGVADVVWFGDSISELDPSGVPIPWYVGRVLSGWTESIQYRNAGAEFTPNMETQGRIASDDMAGLGGHSVVLGPGRCSCLSALGEAVSVLWTSRPGGGQLAVSWGEEHLGTIDTDGNAGASQVTVYRRPAGFLPEDLVITAAREPATLEGVYVHDGNVDSGVRVWPAARSGNTTQDFLDHPSWGLDALATLSPALVVIATGTNVATDYPSELDAMITAVRSRTEADIAVWVPFLNSSFTAEEAAAGRAVADRHGCLVVDGAATLGFAPTVDGAHPNAVGTALAAAHIATVLSGTPLETATLIAGQAVASLRSGQQWRPGVGSVTVDAPVGSSIISGKGHQDDGGHEWVLILAEFARSVLGLPGATLSFGPGGDDPVDTHLSRRGAGRLALNVGRGQIDVGRVSIGGDGDSDAGVVLATRVGSAGPELVAELPDGSARCLTSVPIGFNPPVPCSFSPAGGGPASDLNLTHGRVIWVPMPVLAVPTAMTHVWLDVTGAAPGWAASAAVVVGLGSGRPRLCVGVTAGEALDLSSPGLCPGELTGEAVVEAGQPWWLAILASGVGPSPSVAATERLADVPLVRLGTPDEVRSSRVGSCALMLDGANAIPDDPGEGLRQLDSTIPVMVVSAVAPHAGA